MIWLIRPMSIICKLLINQKIDGKQCTDLPEFELSLLESVFFWLLVIDPRVILYISSQCFLIYDGLGVGAIGLGCWFGFWSWGFYGWWCWGLWLGAFWVFLWGGALYINVLKSNPGNKNLLDFRYLTSTCFFVPIPVIRLKCSLLYICNPVLHTFDSNFCAWVVNFNNQIYYHS